MVLHAKPTTDLKSSGLNEIGLLESVERAIAELRRGVAVVVTSDVTKEAVLVRAAETVDVWPLPFFSIAGVGPLSLAVTGRRASILGLSQPAAPAVQLASTTAFSPERLRPLIDPQTEGARVPPPGITATAAPPHGAVDGAIRLTKIARLLPAAVVAPLTGEDARAWAQSAGRILVTTAAIESYDCNHADDLRPISEARVPLAGAADTRIVSFRPRDGGAEHLAIVVGAPDPSRPVLTRLHSECFTGDLLESLRCDCGDQLRGAITTLAKDGGGVLLYLAQEGRGIGLVNKLRAYGLQDQGFDTVDANEQLGFDDDERVYLPAVRMLRHLGFTRVRLLTNNPAKVGALARHGIDVTERVPHAFPSNEHNWTYLQTKAKRSGHLF
ncbi:MAG: GTP cyclohydrolase II [Rhodospirillaceae bacterium]|nr:GTP cyclohydrolase II [Rhodospirillaceae bacterium]